MYENGTPLSKCPPQYGKSKNFQALCEFVANWDSNINAYALVDNRIDTNLLSGTPIEHPSSTSLSIINNNNNQYSTVYNRIEPTMATSTTTQRTTITNTPKSRISSSTRRTNSNRRKNTSNRNGNRNRSRSRTASNNNNRNNSNRRNISSSTNIIDQQWNSRLNNWKNNSTTSPSTTSPSTSTSTSSWKWNQSSYDWKKWLTNFTTNTNWTKWESKPQRSIITNANIRTTGQVDPSIRIVTSSRSGSNNNNNNNGNQNNNVPWRLTNITWWTNWTTTTNTQPKAINRITTRLPTYTWSLSLG